MCHNNHIHLAGAVEVLVRHAPDRGDGIALVVGESHELAESFRGGVEGECGAGKGSCHLADGGEFGHIPHFRSCGHIGDLELRDGVFSDGFGAAERCLPGLDPKLAGELPFQKVEVAGRGGVRLAVGDGHRTVSSGSGEGEIAGGILGKKRSTDAADRNRAKAVPVHIDGKGGVGSGNGGHIRSESACSDNGGGKGDGVGVGGGHVVTVAVPASSCLTETKVVGFIKSVMGVIRGGFGRGQRAVVGHRNPFFFANACIRVDEVVCSVVVQVVRVGKPLFRCIIAPAVWAFGVKQEVVALVENAVAAVVHFDGQLLKVVVAEVTVGFGEHRAAVAEDGDTVGGQPADGQTHGGEVGAGDFMHPRLRYGDFVPASAPQHRTGGVGVCLHCLCRRADRLYGDAGTQQLLVAASAFSDGQDGKGGIILFPVHHRADCGIEVALLEIIGNQCGLLHRHPRRLHLRQCHFIRFVKSICLKAFKIEGECFIVGGGNSSIKIEETEGGTVRNFITQWSFPQERNIFFDCL